ADLLADGRVKLSQKRFLSYGVTAPDEQLWRIPVSLSYSDGSAVKTQHVLLADREMTITLEGVSKPAWINPNAGPSGYYRWNVSSDMMNRLALSAADVMNPVERAGFLGNLSALLDGGLIHGDEYVRILPRFADDKSPEVVLCMMDGMGVVQRVFVTKQLEEPFSVYVRKNLAPAVARFGLTRKEGEGDAVSFLRPALIRM